MYDYIVDSFAGILTKGDIVALFNELVDHYSGNRSKAAREIGVTSKTTYGWENVNYIKHDTKMKVLKAILEHRHLVAFEYLLERTSDKQTDILRTVLIELYSEAIGEEDPEAFGRTYLTYEEIRTHFRGTIRDHIEEEISEMNQSLEERAEELGVPIFEPTIDDLTAKNLVDTLPIIAMEYRANPSNPAEAARTLNLPVGSIQTLWSTFSSMRAPKPLYRDIEDRGTTWDITRHFIRTNYKPIEPKKKFETFIHSAFGTLVVTSPYRELWESCEAYQEDATTHHELRPALLAEITVPNSNRGV